MVKCTQCLLVFKLVAFINEGMPAGGKKLLASIARLGAILSTRGWIS
jgi:hypothetical protein